MRRKGMIKAVCIALAAVMLAGGVTGCAGDKETEQTQAKAPPLTEEEAAEYRDAEMRREIRNARRRRAEAPKE